MKITLIYSTIILTATLAFFGCQKDQVVNSENSEVNIAQVRQDVQKSLREIQTVQGLREGVETRAVAAFIVVPANSNNALVQAIADAGEGGIVYLRRGVHTETVSITIRQRVLLIGEDGAILKIKSTANASNADGSQTVSVGLHVLNAPRTLVQNIDFQPIAGNGGAALLMQNSNESAMMFCTVSKHQYGLIVEKSDRMTIMRNKMTIADGWQTGALGTALGITIVNGTSAYVADNTISNAVFAIWACDRYGTCERNTTTGSFLGIILCNVPRGYILPSGEVIGSLVSGAYWKVRNNTSTDNFTTGYLIIDGANNNLLENNQAARNGTYDVELTGDSYRYGFLTPKCFNNTVNVMVGQTVKNCGVNNTVNGGNLVNNATDPCN